MVHVAGLSRREDELTMGPQRAGAAMKRRMAQFHKTSRSARRKWAVARKPGRRRDAMRTKKVVLAEGEGSCS